MDVPDWRSFDGSTKSRAALWLRAEIGEGRTFTKEMLRQAFPDVAQIDRRVRDLRDNSWVIQTNREDVTLSAGEQRLVQIGDAVWDPSHRSATSPKKPTAKQRQETFATDDYCCVMCGITAGQAYPEDALRRATLTVLPGRGSGEDREWVTGCDRCRNGPASVPEYASVAEQFAQLSTDEQRAVRNWSSIGAREPTAAEKVWRQLRRLPHQSRQDLLR